ncbi:MAG TPA: methylated-DNA--[protein]-cysteine S-methyltransferase, partial [Kineosporiaceae bacterium]
PWCRLAAMAEGGDVTIAGVAPGGAAGGWSAVTGPAGELTLACDGAALTHVLFEAHRGGASPESRRIRAGPRDDADPVLRQAAAELAEYFAGARRVFEVPLAPRGSAFQLAVWVQLRTIPYGATVSYGDIARRLGLPPGASRAVGLANGSNPISIIIPCHRVIGADGSLTGYGGGLPRKRFLLDLESGVAGDRLF